MTRTEKENLVPVWERILFINSDSQRDVAHLRKRYFAQKNDGN